MTTSFIPDGKRRIFPGFRCVQWLEQPISMTGDTQNVPERITFKLRSSMEWRTRKSGGQSGQPRGVARQYESTRPRVRMGDRRTVGVEDVVACQTFDNPFMDLPDIL